MKDKQSIITTLLSRYYDGSATTTEIATLRRLLDSLDDAEMTPDLRLERELMHALYTAQPTDDADIPSDLEARLEAATIGAESRPKAPVGRRPVRLYRALAVAASLVLVLGIAWRFTIGHAPAPAVSESLAQVTERTDAEATVITAQPIEEIDVKDEAKNTPVVTRRIVPLTHQTDGTPEVTFREVTDTAEAMRITLEVLHTLDRALAQADKDVAPVLKTIDGAGRQIENISQIIEQSLI